MATGLFRKKMIEAYREMRAPDQFLSSFFMVRPGNISDSQEITVDVERWDEDVAPVVNVCEGPNFVSIDQFTNKTFTPPAYEEAMPFDCADLLKRNAGETEYGATDVSFQASLVSRILKGAVKLEQRIKRAIEVQASQILQTGILDLWDVTGNTKFTIDFKAKPAHFPTVTTSWSNGASDPLGDLESLADVIRDDSMIDADILIMGSSAFNNFIKHADVLEIFDNRSYAMGEIRPVAMGNGGKRQGRISIGNYMFEIWTYNGRYIDATNTKVKFVGDDNVIMLSTQTRLDKLFGGVPRAVSPDPRFADFLPDRISVPEATDFSPNIYSTPNGRQTILELCSRPLLVPTAIDGFGCLDTTV